jgi:hypothetical protein
MIGPKTERLFTLPKARMLSAFERGGKRPNLSTLYEWANVGVSGVKLETIPQRSGRCTSEAAALRFITALGPALESTDAASSEFDEGGHHWIWNRLGRKRYRIFSMLRWTREGCPLLGGRKPQYKTRRVWSARRQRQFDRLYFRQKDYEAINEVRNAPRITDGWCSVAEAKELFAFGRGFLQAWARRCHPLLHRPIKKYRAPRPSWKTTKWETVYCRHDLQELFDKRKGERRSEDVGWLSAREAHEQFGFLLASMRIALRATLLDPYQTILFVRR